MEHRHVISPATTPAVFAALTSADYLRAFSAALGVELGDLTLGTSGPWHQATMSWLLPTGELAIPAPVRPFLSDPVTLTWRQDWRTTQAFTTANATGHPTHQGQLEVVLQGRPGASTEGFVELRPDGPGVLIVSQLTTRVQLMKMLAAPIEAAIETQLVEWILSVQTRVLRDFLD